MVSVPGQIATIRIVVVAVIRVAITAAIVIVAMVAKSASKTPVAIEPPAELPVEGAAEGPPT
jgi:hypothetical protein